MDQMRVAPAQSFHAMQQAAPAGVQWFTQAQRGLFIHWGIYSLLERGEWVMHHEHIPVETYATLADRFQPRHFDANTWASLAVDAGLRYIVITSKHHDGFCMFHTALSAFNITNTRWKRDPLLELAAACAKHGIKLGVYYSLVDWTHPSFRSHHDWSAYVSYVHGQVQELCTNYGPLGSFWFDGLWRAAPPAYYDFLPRGDFALGTLYDTIHTLQPACMIGNNHREQPLPGEDFQIFELDVPGEHVGGFVHAPPGNWPLESCLPMHASWGYNRDRSRDRLAEDLVAFYRKCRERNANVLFNVGPRADGMINPRHAATLRRLGTLLQAEAV